MNVCGGVDVQIHIFLTSALVGDEWSASRSGRFTPGTHWGWAPQPVWTTSRKVLTLPGLELQPLGSPARSQSLYRQRYPGTWRGWGNHEKPSRIAGYPAKIRSTSWTQTHSVVFRPTCSVDLEETQLTWVRETARLTITRSEAHCTVQKRNKR
jgi:hypothetical protein